MGQSLRLSAITLMLLFAQQAYSEETYWPVWFNRLLPAPSSVGKATAFPSDLKITPPASDVPAQQARWSGTWTGWAWDGSHETKLAVERVDGSGADIVYLYAWPTDRPQASERVRARFDGDDLIATLQDGSKLAYRLRDDRTLQFLFIGTRPTSNAPGATNLTPGILTKDADGTAPLLADRKAVWPSNMASLRPAETASPVIAQLAEISIAPPSQTVADTTNRWLGIWTGWACQDQACSTKLAVESVDPAVSLVFAFASGRFGKTGPVKVAGEIVGNELRAKLPNDEQLAYRMRDDGTVEFLYLRSKGRAMGVLQRDK